MTGIITAIKEEFDSVKDYLTITKEEKIAGMNFLSGTYNNKEFVLAECGIGKVNAACCTQILVDRFHIDQVINVGVGGALNNDLKIGDTVVSTDAFQYDMDATIFGSKLGEIPNMNIIFFEASKDLIEKAKKKAKENDIDIKVGRICTADLGLSDKNIKEMLVNDFEGMICDMEGAAIAQAAYLNNIPYLVIRSVSDNADEEANEFYTENKQESSDNGAELVAKIMEVL